MTQVSTIRTALLKDGKACVQAGGGWVNDSEPEAEFQETVNKSKALFPHNPHPVFDRPLPHRGRGQAAGGDVCENAVAAEVTRL